MSLASLLFYSSLVSCASSWAAWRASLSSLLFYSSLVSCDSSWAAWRAASSLAALSAARSGGRLSAVASASV